MAKFCTKCETEKDRTEFGKRTRSKDGLFCWCKVCQSKHAKKRYIENKDHINEINAKWKRDNPSKHKSINAKWREDNADRHRESGRQWSLDNKGRRKELSHRWYTENSQKVIEKNAKWKADHPEKAKEMRIRAGEKTRSTLYGKLNGSMSVSIRAALKSLKAGRRWETLVGYTVNDLKAHLERQFIDGMSWENYGKNGWEIDHKVPKSIFHYECPEDIDFKKAWSLKNLQPLWRSANRRKYNKIDIPFQPSLLLREGANG